MVDIYKYSGNVEVAFKLTYLLMIFTYITGFARLSQGVGTNTFVISEFLKAFCTILAGSGITGRRAITPYFGGS
jgi:hypothetical protein